jgi:aminobenzoyl-glutamate utilization protein B
MTGPAKLGFRVNAGEGKVPKEMSFIRTCPLILLLAGCVANPFPLPARAESLAGLSPEKLVAEEWIEQNEARLKATNQRIWSAAELGLEEHQSSEALIELLRQNGFKVQRGVADMPTAFVASYGSGKPVIGILAEYDALPGLSQTAAPQREARAGAESGHGCGHSIFGTASSAGAIAVRQALEKQKLKGTIRLYGTPAEETLIGKVYMAKAGLFDDCDAVLHWHPGDKTDAGYETSKAMVSAKFAFRGLAAHASSFPHEGKSALDAVELMNMAANFWREHLPEDARVHYVISDGGGQPNVVPPRAEVWYYLRADKHREVERMFERLVNMAKGAMLMTGASYEVKIDSETHEVLPNLPLAQLVHKNLTLVGPPQFTEAEKAFAKKTQAELEKTFDYALSERIESLPAAPERRKGSTDVGEVSWRVPTAGLRVASWTYGAPSHSWHVAACTGMSIGEKGMLVASRTLAFTALDLFTDSGQIRKAREDFEKARAGAEFKSLLSKDQKPPVKIR